MITDLEIPSDTSRKLERLKVLGRDPKDSDQLFTGKVGS